MSPFREACAVLEACHSGRDTSMLEIAEQVARKYGLSVKLMRSKNMGRLNGVIRARQEAMIRCRLELNKSFGEIGRFFGRDHSTVFHAWRKAGHAHSQLG